jgi:hypothetical protein
MIQTLRKKLVISLAVICSACLNLGKRMPAQRPADFVLTYHLDGGRRYYSENLHISADSCVFTKNEEGKITDKHFTLSAGEMDALYDYLRDKKTDYIEYYSEKEVYDRGGITVQIAWNQGKEHISISDAQRDFVKKKWQDNWSEICTHLRGIVAAK